MRCDYFCMGAWLLKLLSLSLLSVFISATTIAQVTVIKAGRLIDSDKGVALTDQVIVIRENKIEAVGSGLAIPESATVIDLSQMTVLPGLIDCHTHLADGKYGQGAE
jgi:imidazolonepropionase-like amidohydrolase